MIRLFILGALDLRGAEGRELTSVLAQRKRLALLAYLACTPGVFRSRDTLLGLFWAETDERRARNSLNQALYQLRRALGADVVVTRGTAEVGLAPDAIWCDMAAFEEALAAGRWREALELYRGDLLEGVYVEGAPEFGRWAERERQRLREGANRAAAALAEGAGAAGDHEQAVYAARRATEISPDDEAVARSRIALHDRLGDPAGALRTYEELCRWLQQEYDMEPSPETQALVAEVRARKVPLAQPVQRAPAREPGGEPARPSIPRAQDEGQGGSAPPARPAESRTSRMGRMGRMPRYAVGVSAAVVAVLVLLAAAVFLWPKEPPLDQKRVLVAVFENQTGDPALDPLGRMVADWVTQGLTQAGIGQVVPALTALRTSQLADSLRGADPSSDPVGWLAEETGAGTIVWGAYYLDGDSVRIQTRISDVAEGTEARGIDVVAGTRAEPLGAVQTLRERVVAALAARFDDAVAPYAPAASQPPSYEAYLHYTEGAHLFLGGDSRAAAERFDRAAAADTAFTMASLWGAISREHFGAWPEIDSIARRLESRRERLAPYDRHLLDALLATLRGDSHGRARAMAEAMVLAPGSLAQYGAAYDALRVNLAGRAAALLEGMDARRGDLRGWIWYWDVLTEADHVLGQHRRELHDAREGKKQYPDNLLVAHFEIRALAALGRVAEVHAAAGALRDLRPTHGATQGQGLRLAAQELRAHGHREDANRLFAQAIAWYRSRTPETRSSPRHLSAYLTTLYQAGRWHEARAVADSLAVAAPDRVRDLGYDGVLAARLGEREAALRSARQLAAVREPYLFGRDKLWRASIAAALGEPRGAAELLRAALREGQGFSIDLHRDVDFLPFVGTPDFQGLLRPRT